MSRFAFIDLLRAKDIASIQQDSSTSYNCKNQFWKPINLCFFIGTLEHMDDSPEAQ